MRKTLTLLVALTAALFSPGVMAVEISDTPEEAINATPADTVGGRYYFVPDSLKAEVESILSRKVPGNEEKEYTVFRGDTIPMILKDRNLGRKEYNRGLYNHLFIPKGGWMFGITASYGQFSTTDLEIFDLLNDIDLNAHTFSIKPYLGYFVRSNLAVGARFSYTNTKGGVDSFKVDIDDDMNFNLHDIHYDSEAYTTSVFLNQYIGMSRRGRFGITNEVSLAFSSGNSRLVRPFGGEPKETFTTYMDARLTFSPGVCVFMMKNVSLNVSFGVFGFYLRNEKQKVDGEDMGNRFTSGANFKFNIFNISMGLAVHI